MQCGQHSHHFAINIAAPWRRHFRQQCVPKDAALDVVLDVERAADHLTVLAQGMNRRHRPAGIFERWEHAKLAVDGMRRWQQLARRLAPEYIAARRRLHQKRRVGLTAGELLHVDGTGKPSDVTLHPRGETRRVEAVPRRGLPQARRWDVRGHVLEAPPSTAMYCPVTCRDASEAR